MTKTNISQPNHFTSEQLLGPTGSLKQLEIAMTAASIDASSPCFNKVLNHDQINIKLS